MSHPHLYRHPADGNEMILIPAGKSLIGSAADDPDAEDRERPQFEVELPDYYIGLACVTNEQYAVFLSSLRPSSSDLEEWILLDSDCHVVSRDGAYEVDDAEQWALHPVVQASWYGAVAYCAWAGLRLPTELEWEKAARGPQGFRYPWGDEWDGERCRHSGGEDSEGTCEVWDYPHGVSGYGLYNPGGNVWEWCSDWYDEKVYARYARGDLTPPATGDDRVVRGGSWYYGLTTLFRAAYRSSSFPANRYFSLGFRCVRGL
jgi:formylglycine-generating enzyme required for sulfatase activity